VTHRDRKPVKFDPREGEVMTTPINEELDVLVVGAGFGGLYQLDRLRTLGFSVKVYEAGSDIGGVWYWNCYPGARVDTYAPLYQFSREELWREWNWSELYPGREELRRYFHHVGETLGLHEDIRLNTRVVGAEFDEERRQWVVRVRNELTGELSSARARYVLLCLGFGSKPYVPEIPGIDTFAGDWFHTAHWPQNGFDTTGKRVGVIGTGASGVQVIQECAPDAAHLTVFQRTPNMALPMRQQPLDDEANRKLRQTYPQRFAARDMTFGGLDYDFQDKGALELSEDERTATMEKLWDEGGLKLWLGGFLDVFFEPEANSIVYEFWRDKVRARINDSALAEKLAPTLPPHPFGVKRCSLEQRYYEVYNRDNVELVDLRDTPIHHVTPAGVVTGDGREHALDVLVVATGFDAFTGGMTAIDIRGTKGESFAEVYEDGARTAFGKATAGFPNLLYVYGPQSPSSFCNGPTCAELEGEWLVQCLEYLRQNGLTRIEATREAEREWGAHLAEIAEPSLFPHAKSWYMGANVPGKKTELLAYIGGLPTYLQKCNDSAEKGYEGFVLS
jgi:cyclohexanone monooxygenase